MDSKFVTTNSTKRGASCRLVRALPMLALLAATACGSRTAGDGAAGIIVVNAPAAGVVRRVLAGEGAHVAEGAPVVEIGVSVEGEGGARAQATEDPQARAARGVTASQAEVEAARAEVVRTEVEVQRLTPLVASGAATQGELDGARAQYDRAQQRFRRAQDAAQGAQSGLIAARQPGLNSSGTTATAATPAERIVAAQASSAGVVSVLSVRVGERVTAGQPLATLRADK
jgi:multidrug resistance efflux pump